jgi:hypothetical protein
MRFSGHDTFHCKEQWLLKGVQLLDNQINTSIFNSEDAIFELGVGKNMVRSIRYWLRSFSLINDNDEFSAYSEYLFINKKYDPYLESPSTLFILQYLLVSKKYASIYNIIFTDFFKDKTNHEFSEAQVIAFIKRVLNDLQIKKFTEKTVRSDFKVFIRTYVSPKKNIKTIEDDFSAPLLELKLISNTGRKNDLNQSVYRINRSVRANLSEFVFAFCLLDYFPNYVTIDFTDIVTHLGAFLCLSNEGVEEIIGRLCQSDNRFVFKSDAGVKQLQLKQSDLYIKDEMLSNIYS